MARPIVRAVTGTTLVKRIIFDAESINDVTSANYDNPNTFPLLVCQETMDEEIEANGTVAAQVPLYSKLNSMRLKLWVQGDAAIFVRWMIFKSPDADITVTDLTDGTFHSSNDTQAARELRKCTLAKGMVFVSPDKLGTSVPVRISRGALQRNASFREGDTINLVMAKQAAGGTATLNGFGTAYVRANA